MSSPPIATQSTCVADPLISIATSSRASSPSFLICTNLSPELLQGQTRWLPSSGKTASRCVAIGGPTRDGTRADDRLKLLCERAGVPRLAGHVPAVLGSAAFFFVVQGASSWLTPRVFPEQYKKLSRRTQLDWGLHMVHRLSLEHEGTRLTGLDRLGGFTRSSQRRSACTSSATPRPSSCSTPSSGSRPSRRKCLLSPVGISFTTSSSRSFFSRRTESHSSSTPRPAASSS